MYNLCIYRWKNLDNVYFSFPMENDTVLIKDFSVQSLHLHGIHTLHYVLFSLKFLENSACIIS